MRRRLRLTFRCFHLIDEIAQHHARPALTIGLTPVLLEQLAHERFKTGFVAYLNERMDRAARDRTEFESRNEPEFVQLAIRWEKWYDADAWVISKRSAETFPVSSRPLAQWTDFDPDQQCHTCLSAVAAE